jgi:hypothetical protein
VLKNRMPRREPGTQLEKLKAHPGFRCTDAQYDWFEECRIAAGQPSLGDWLREVAKEAGLKLIDKPFPLRKPATADSDADQPPAKPAKKQRRR